MKKGDRVHKKRAPKLPKLTLDEIVSACDKKLQNYLSETQLKLIKELAVRNCAEKVILARFKIHQNTLCNWRNDPVFSELAQRAEHQAYEHMTKFGYGNKEQRLKLLTRQLNAIEKLADTFNSMKYTEELRAFSKQIAEEMGQLEQKLHLAGDVKYISYLDHGTEEAPTDLAAITTGEVIAGGGSSDEDIDNRSKDE